MKPGKFVLGHHSGLPTHFHQGKARPQDACPLALNPQLLGTLGQAEERWEGLCSSPAFPEALGVRQRPALRTWKPVAGGTLSPGQRVERRAHWARQSCRRQQEQGGAGFAEGPAGLQGWGTAQERRTTRPGRGWGRLRREGRADSLGVGSHRSLLRGGWAERWLAREGHSLEMWRLPGQGRAGRGVLVGRAEGWGEGRAGSHGGVLDASGTLIKNPVSAAE